MAPIGTKGNPSSNVWVVVELPYPQDKDKGFVFSGGYGYVFDKMMHDAKIPNYYVIARRNDFEHLDSYVSMESYLKHYQPKIIIPLGDSLGFFCNETRKKIRAAGKSPDEARADLDKYSGSILSTDPHITDHSHYVIPTLPPDEIVRDWSLRDICVNLDLGKAADELEYFKQHGTLKPLPIRTFDYDFDSTEGFERLMGWFDRFKNASRLSVDIESIYTLKSSAYWPHPGVPITCGLADSVSEGISFRFFRESRKETVHLWRRLDDLLYNVPLLGQNFFNFDAPRLNSLGFTVPYESISDTIIRHHILWPELPHKLQFQTRQYTREPYYKDEGHGWSIKDLRKLMRYNCLDVCVTMEIYLAQEKEFDERPYLR